MNKITEAVPRGCRGRPLTAQESIIGDAEDIIHEAVNLVDAIWMAVAEADVDTREPVRALADAAKAKLGAALMAAEKLRLAANLLDEAEREAKTTVSTAA